MGDADHVAYEDAVAEWDAVEQLGFFLSKKWSIPHLFFARGGSNDLYNDLLSICLITDCMYNKGKFISAVKNELSKQSNKRKFC